MFSSSFPQSWLVSQSLPLKNPHSMMLPCFWFPSLDLCLDTILSRSSSDSSFGLMTWSLLWHALSTVGPYIDKCVPFQIMSNQLNLPQVDPVVNQVVETSQGWSIETGCTWAQLRVSQQRIWILIYSWSLHTLRLESLKLVFQPLH